MISLMEIELASMARYLISTWEFECRNSNPFLFLLALIMRQAIVLSLKRGSSVIEFNDSNHVMLFTRFLFFFGVFIFSHSYSYTVGIRSIH